MRQTKKHLSSLYADSADLTTRFLTKKKGVDLEACDVFFRPSASEVEGRGEHPESRRIQTMVYLPLFTYIYHNHQVNLGEFSINTWMVWVGLLQD